MNTSPLIPGAADSAALDAALPTSITPAPGVQETPDDLPGVTALQTRGLAQPVGDVLPTVVQARPVAPLPALPRAMGLSDRQRRALQALAGGMGPHAAAEIAGVSPVTVFRWRKYDARFIAALNAWKAESLKTAQEYLAAANEHAARTILRAVEAGDVRTSLAVVRGLGALAPQKVGPAYARLVERDLDCELETVKAGSGKRSREMRKEQARKELEDKRKADADANETARVAARWALFEGEYLKIPPLPRPVTAAAVADAVASKTNTVRTYSTRCSFTIVAATAINDDDPGLLADQLARDSDMTFEAVEAQLKSLPWLLNQARKVDQVEGYARLLESLGATIELRASWVE